LAIRPLSGIIKSDGQKMTARCYFGEILHTRFKLFLFIFLFAFYGSATEKIFIISGFDDVLRQAENTGLIKASLKIFEKDKTFSGMPELYNAITRDEISTDKFILVSAISSWFDHRIAKFLVESNYPPNRRYLRNWLTEWSIENFKISNIRHILAEKPNRRFIVIFDNSDASLKLVEKLQSEFPGKISAIYLRKVVEKKLPVGAIYFFSAFDIALNEFNSHRLGKNDVIAIGNIITATKDVENLFPKYAICPTEYNPCLGIPTELVDICSKVKLQIVKICSASNSYSE
jgi:hypothetical protein